MQKRFPVNYISNLINSPSKKILLENFFALSLIQALNYLIPLITLPYLVRVIGPEKFGLISFAQALIGYFVILTDYGFNLSATREISIHRENKQKLNEIYSSVMILKFLLCVLSFIILSLICFTIPKFKKDYLVYIYTFGLVLGNVIFPIWFFQGMERMRYITIIHTISRMIFMIFIFIFIKKISDYLYVPLINSIGILFGGMLSLGLIYRDFGVRLLLPSVEAMKHQLKEGWHIFISTMATSLYTTSNVFILGLFTNNTVVGYYSAAEKIIRTIQGLLTPVSQTAYPRISKLVSESKEKAINFIKKMIKTVGIVSFIISSIIFVFSVSIVNIILGEQFGRSIIVLRLLSFLPFIISLSNIFGIQTMLTFNYKDAFSKILIAAGILNIILAFVLVPFFKEVGISIAVVITEIFVTVSMFVYIEKKGIKLLKREIL